MTLSIENYTKRLVCNFEDKHFEYIIQLLEDDTNSIEKEIRDELLSGFKWVYTGNENYLLPEKK